MSAMIWVLDDSPLEAKRAERVLSEQFQVAVFGDGSILLEQLGSAGTPDVVVLDWHLPGISGIEVCRFLRTRWDQVALPILMLTSAGHKPDIVEGLSAGANDYLTKPYDATELLARVVSLARIRQLHDRAQRAEDERQRMFEREQRARAEAEAANALKDEFLATVSHELRSPLTAILGWTQVLRSGELPEAQRAAALETIERNAHAQTQLIEDLLDVARIISGHLRIELLPVDLAAVINAAIASATPAAEAKGVALRPLLDPGAGSVAGDAARLEQVVWNLVTNAVKFTPRGGRIEVRLERIDGSVEIVVADTGEGIAVPFLPHVFERFRQADGGASRSHRGLGLGLAIVKQLVELHGGSIRALSEGEGRGSTFTVHLPLGTPHAGAERRTPGDRRSSLPELAGFADQDEVAEIEGLRVLVVDDEADTRGLLVTMLEQRGAVVTAADSAADALETLGRVRPDVMVSDLGMPGEDGYSLIRKIRALSADAGGRTPVVALTAYARAEDRRRALRAGFNMHVAKPIDTAELLAVVGSLATQFPRG